MREHYERKLERANNLYMDLTACMLQLEKREQELIKYVTVTSQGFAVTISVVLLTCHVFAVTFIVFILWKIILGLINGDHANEVTVIWFHCTVAAATKRFLQSKWSYFVQ